MAKLQCCTGKLSSIIDICIDEHNNQIINIESDFIWESIYEKINTVINQTTRSTSIACVEKNK